MKSEILIARLKAAEQMAIETLQRLDMGSKGVNIQAAKLQARAEAMRQVAEWCEERTKDPA